MPMSVWIIDVCFERPAYIDKQQCCLNQLDIIERRYAMLFRKEYKMVLRVAAMLMLLIMIPVCTFAESIGTVNCSSLNLRSKATKNSKALQTLSRGDSVRIMSTSGDWYKVNYGKYTGYVMKAYISTDAAPAESSDSKSTASSGSDVASLKKIGKPAACEVGAKGSNVKKLQKCLAALGYYQGKIDGDYGRETKSAVQKLQKELKLKQTGNADSETIAAMFGENTAPVAKGTTERLNWFRDGIDRIPRGATFTVKDCKTGKTFQCKRWAGANHLDAEPLTKKDTEIMNDIYGKWSWNRRPILVKYNGRIYAASMNGMPHGTTTISDNQFAGHFCIHFYGSMTHSTKKKDAAHQNAVAAAMDYTW